MSKNPGPIPFRWPKNSNPILLISGPRQTLFQEPERGVQEEEDYKKREQTASWVSVLAHLRRLCSRSAEGVIGVKIPLQIWNRFEPQSQSGRFRMRMVSRVKELMVDRGISNQL
jgi:hypothetical protein